MNELKARNISLLVFSIQVLLLYLYTILSNISSQIDMIAYNENMSKSGVLFLICIFIALALIIILSLRFKWVYYLFAIMGIAIIVLAFSYIPLTLFEGVVSKIGIALFILFPYVVYSALLVVKNIKKHYCRFNEKDTES